MDLSTNSTQDINNLTQEITIKEEFNPNIEENFEVKTEPDISDNADNAHIEADSYSHMQKDVHIQNTLTEDFGENEIHIKEEFTVSIEPDDSQSSAEVATVKNEVDTEIIVPTSLDDAEVKQEPVVQDSEPASYNYPNYEDSMDSSEAAALSQVEACLSDNINSLSEGVNVKIEDDAFEDNQKDFPRVIKEESELTVTETQLISNKFINTTSTITNTHDGVIQSQTTKTLIMEIHPMTGKNQALKMGNPEEILPTTEEDYEDMDCDSFQLNSITGNVLSLEQEAYGLLKTKTATKTTTGLEIICPKCPKVFNTKFLLNRHLKVHEGIEKRANGIIKGLQTKMKRRKEIKLDDDEIKMEAKALGVKEEAVSIKKEEREGYKCTCGKTFRRRSRMETCLRSHTDYADSRSYDCPTCEKKFKSKELLILHRQRQHRKKFPCKFCPTDYHTQKELFKHLQIHQKVQLTEYKVITEVANGKQELQCLLCDKSCTNLPDFKSHIMEDHTEPYKCPHCAETFPKISDFAIHVKKTHTEVGDQSVLDVLEAFSKLVKAWKCEECGKQFHEADKLALHQVEEHAPDMRNEQHFQCRDCQRVFISKSGLNSHMRMHHRTEGTEEPEPEEVGVLCLECRKICPDMNALTSHMRLHSMDRKYPCKFCDFRFATPQKRKKHAEIHTGDMKYVCFICEYTCSSENRLKQHKMSIKHANMKEYLLTGKPLIEEEQSTSKQQKIKDTLRKKEWGVKKKKKRDKDGDIACDICGDMFGSESEMQEHKQIHPFIEFPNDDKPSRIFFK